MCERVLRIISFSNSLFYLPRTLQGTFSKDWFFSRGIEMIRDSDRRIVSEFRSRLEAIIPILDLRVFGSRARGDATEESDLDVFIKITELDRSCREKISDLAWEVGFKYDLVISTFVVTEAQVKRGAIGASPLLSKVLQEGIIV
jgi:predicted nucleotidyltransferase